MCVPSTRAHAFKGGYQGQGRVLSSYPFRFVPPFRSQKNEASISVAPFPFGSSNVLKKGTDFIRDGGKYERQRSRPVLLRPDLFFFSNYERILVTQTSLFILFLGGGDFIIWLIAQPHFNSPSTKPNLGNHTEAEALEEKKHVP